MLQEEDGKNPFPHIPIKEPAEIVEDVNRKGESEEMRSALECAENRDDAHCALDDDGGDEHRVSPYSASARFCLVNFRTTMSRLSRDR
jgi:hypothetical protein